jgi:D-glycero-D-manno-heptose 1,7-bisphosphate phosphatase
MSILVYKNYDGQLAKRDGWHITMSALILDLDGTVRGSTSGPFINHPSEIYLLPQAEEKIQEYVKSNYLICGVTNQGGVAYGYKTETDILVELDVMMGLFTVNPFSIIVAALNHERGTDVKHGWRSLHRKPSYGMLAKVEEEAFNHKVIIDWDHSLMVGDREEDFACAINAQVEFKWADEFFERNEYRRDLK